MFMAATTSGPIAYALRGVGRKVSRSIWHGSQRAASSKHPNGFVAPTYEDLIELRERVQEFTRMQSSIHVPRVSTHLARSGDSRRSCCEDRSGK